MLVKITKVVCLSSVPVGVNLLNIIDIHISGSRLSTHSYTELQVL